MFVVVVYFVTDSVQKLLDTPSDIPRVFMKRFYRLLVLFKLYETGVKCEARISKQVYNKQLS